MQSNVDIKDLSNLQKELLKLYQQDISDQDLINIKKLLAKYFAQAASTEMDRLWDHHNWTSETMDSWLSDKNA